MPIGYVKEDDAICFDLPHINLHRFLRQQMNWYRIATECVNDEQVIIVVLLTLQSDASVTEGDFDRSFRVLQKRKIFLSGLFDLRIDFVEGKLVSWLTIAGDCTNAKSDQSILKRLAASALSKKKISGTKPGVLGVVRRRDFTFLRGQVLKPVECDAAGKTPFVIGIFYCYAAIEIAFSQEDMLAHQKDLTTN